MTTPLKILLVDDQPAKLLSYEAVLAELGETLIRAGSAREALSELLRNEIAIILIDVRMPELDGFELAAMIRAHPRFQSTAIIFVSAEALTDLDRLKGYSYGAVDYLPVPIIPELLRAKVRVFAELYRTTRQLKRLNSELEARVAERTAELHAANAELEARVEARTREREMALAQLHEAQKLESLGQLTGGLAHDFNNLLMAIMGSLDQLERRLHHDEGVSGLIEGALKSAERGAALTKRMLAFARRQELKPKPVEVCRLIKGMEEMLARTLGPSTRITMAFEEGLAPVQIDPNQLELALLNLALNARDAMPDGGSLTIEAGTVTIEAGTADLAPGHYISIRVTDTGIGMDELVLKRAAEPFFTTKAVGKGTGLGLSMVHGLAAQSGGCMRISSGTGRGTTIALYLPVAGSGAASGRAKAAPSLSPQAIRPLVVLVVDDDHLVAASTRGMLESLGHEVIVAFSGEEALTVIASRSDLDLVITDHAMPGMTGLELARHIQGGWPTLPIILASGYGDDRLNEDPDLMLLAKPYRSHDLESLLRPLFA